MEHDPLWVANAAEPGWMQQGSTRLAAPSFMKAVAGITVVEDVRMRIKRRIELVLRSRDLL